MESGWNVWVWLVGVVSRRWEWVESMGVATGCGFKEIYRFPHTTYPYSSCICTFLQQHPYFFFHFVIIIDCNEGHINHRLRTHGTGLETCHVSTLNACKTKRPLPCYRNSHLTGVRTLLSLYIIYGILYLKDRSGSCGTILEKSWGL